jgi:hypothetical protein
MLFGFSYFIFRVIFRSKLLYFDDRWSRELVFRMAITMYSGTLILAQRCNIYLTRNRENFDEEVRYRGTRNAYHGPYKIASEFFVCCYTEIELKLQQSRGKFEYEMSRCMESILRWSTKGLCFFLFLRRLLDSMNRDFLFDKMQSDNGLFLDLLENNWKFTRSQKIIIPETKRRKITCNDDISYDFEA